MQSFPAYFVGSTAPNNVEDPIGKVNNPAAEITTIAEFLSKQENPQLLITVHGYNTALGEFSPVRYAATDKATDKTTDKTTVKGHGVKKWYQDIREHIEEHCAQGSDGLVFIGYRWPSEQINGGGNDSLFHKLWNASQSLPSVLKVIAIIAIALFSIISLTAILNGPSQSASFGIVAVIILILATIAISL
ncbi:MAG: hypothetical protein HC800_18475, partial [Phormidesmis sp. RL_2_1]|nr:hypothetical protein [Phormidesmis sp. RL_2_1]